MKKLLELQKLDLQIEKFRARETEIPKQKNKYDIHLKRLEDELKQSEAKFKGLQVEQRDCEGEVASKQEEIKKKDGQLLAVKKNEEYQALLHEMELLKKQIGVKEERILTIMEDMDNARTCFEEDKQRIAGEKAEIAAECAKIDEELAVAVAERESLESRRKPLIAAIDATQLRKYDRIRRAKKAGAALVPLQGESCSGCFMGITAQNVNEILGGEFVPCRHCGRLVYHAPMFEEDAVEVTEGGN